MFLRATMLRTLFLLGVAGSLLAAAGCYIDNGELVDGRWAEDASQPSNDGLYAGDEQGSESADDSDSSSDYNGIDDSYDALEAEHLSDSIEPSHGTGESEAEGLINAPEEVAVFVGEILEVDVYVTDPSLGSLLPAALPERAVFESLATGGRVRWQPRLEDIGSHDFVFLIVDADEPSLVVAQQTMSVEVLPRFSLVEYGF